MAIDFEKLKRKAQAAGQPGSAATKLRQEAGVAESARILRAEIEALAKKNSWREIAETLKKQQLDTIEIDGIIEEYQRLMRRGIKDTATEWTTHGNRVKDKLVHAIAKLQGITLTKPDVDFIAPLDVQLRNATRRTQELADEIKHIKGISDRLRTENEELRKKSGTEDAAKLAEAERKLAEADTKIKQLGAELEAARNSQPSAPATAEPPANLPDVTELEQKLAEATDRATQAETEKASIAAELAAEKQAREAAERDRAALQAEKDAGAPPSQELIDLRAELDQARDKLRQGTLNVHVGNSAELQREKGELETKVAELTTDLQEAQEDLFEAQRRLALAEGQLAQRNEDAEQLPFARKHGVRIAEEGERKLAAAKAEHDRELADIRVKLTKAEEEARRALKAGADAGHELTQLKEINERLQKDLKSSLLKAPAAEAPLPTQTGDALSDAEALLDHLEKHDVVKKLEQRATELKSDNALEAEWKKLETTAQQSLAGLNAVAAALQTLPETDANRQQRNDFLHDVMLEINALDNIADAAKEGALAAPQGAAPGVPEDVTKIQQDLERYRSLHQQQAEVIRDVKAPMNKVIDGLIDALTKLQDAYASGDKAAIEQIATETGDFITNEVAPALDEVDKLLETKL